jgi:hypothetical protein
MSFCKMRMDLRRVGKTLIVQITIYTPKQENPAMCRLYCCCTEPQVKHQSKKGSHHLPTLWEGCLHAASSSHLSIL